MLSHADAGGDDLDDLLDSDIDDIFKDVDTNMNGASKPKPPPLATTKSAAAGDAAGTGLGIDEEIKVTKQRKQIVKLDENLLLSQKGIPKLRRLARDRLKFKGKGHEFSDVARLLNLYQFWLDDMYPKAKFADGLAMIEKLGHSKRLQIMRREWIDEGKPRALDDESPRHTANAGMDNSSVIPETSGETQAHQPDTTNGESTVGNSSLSKNNENNLFLSDDEDGDMYSQLLEMESEKAANNNASHSQPPEEDELDALLGEGSAMDWAQGVQPGRSNQAQDDDPFEDEMDILREMEKS
ncbi:MAG: chromosome segregation in meiosis- protein [Cirrosporium novae-zelandiae]|nr:MAG: chromosome segregation in meiosis- protein [Cirrosporium novae-zelandiae]